MRSVILRSLLVIGAGALVLTGVLYVASTVDARPPRVVDIHLTQSMPDDERLALVTTSIVIDVSEPIDPDSVERAVSMQPETPGAVSASGSSVTFTPSEPLAIATGYELIVGPGIRDIAGNEMTELPGAFGFETVGRPAVAATEPSDGAVDVPLDEPIVLTFSALMDTASVEAELALRPTFPHELRWSERELEIVPNEPLRPDTDYVITIGEDAADVAGVSLGGAARIAFRTVAPGLEPAILVPSDGVDGVATGSAIAVIFDRPIDPSSVSADLMTIDPPIAGSIAVEPLPDDPPSDDGFGRLLVFTPSAPLPPNTTFSVELAAGVEAASGGSVTVPSSWSFTTGVPIGSISNQITFISSRGGVANVWAANPDGSGQRQLSAELTPILDYAIAPDGSSLVVGDGRRLVHLTADGRERRVLTDDGALEFDPAFSPDGRVLAFARADELTGRGLGLWQWSVGGGDPEPIAVQAEAGASATPTASGDDPAIPLRAPRFSPDGQAIAFVDTRGEVGVIDRPLQRVTQARFTATARPLWLPDSSAVMLTGQASDVLGPPPRFEAPVPPLAPGPDDAVYRLRRSATLVSPSPFGDGARVVAVSSDGEIAYVAGDGSLWLTDLPNSAPGRPTLGDVEVRGAGFAPDGRPLVLELANDDGGATIELFGSAGEDRQLIAREGTMPRWQP